VLQVSNNDMMTADLERNGRRPEFGLVHPYIGAVERTKVKMLGEVSYNRSKERQAFAWIVTHKLRFLQLTAERLRLFWFPDMNRPWQSLFEATLTLAGLGGLALLFWRGNVLALVASVALVAYSAVYYIIQVSPRYRFPLEPMLFLLSAQLLTVRSGLARARPLS